MGITNNEKAIPISRQACTLMLKCELFLLDTALPTKKVAALPIPPSRTAKKPIIEIITENAAKARTSIRAVKIGTTIKKIKDGIIAVET